MYYTTKRSSTSTRLIGASTVVVVCGLLGFIMVTGIGAAVVHEFTETEVAIIDVPEIEEEEPPPPPPVDVELPPPPPQVILPDFVFETPPPQNAIRQVEQVREPAPPPAVRPPPPPKPAVTIAQKPSPGRRFEKPDYPAASIRAKEEGEVVVSVCVDTNGRMSDVKIVKSSGHPRLDEATLRGLPRTRLDPARGTDGKPIAMCDPPYVFTLVWNLEEAR